ncbi:MAG: amidase family protein, partial [Pseudomonas sp.]|uniref:amidase family protein n=1 Tax=Pseudomonas sp. TaxID=306 RepID=UPI003D6DF304
MQLNKNLVVCSFLVLTASAQADDGIDRMTLADMRHALNNGTISSEHLVQHYLDNIQANNHQGENINALVTVNEQAIDQARKWDAERAKNPNAKYAPLAGIPFVVKDNFDTAGMVTSGGSYVLRSSVPSQDAFTVKKLIDGQAILLGKANLS